jgi:hypothetical protein
VLDALRRDVLAPDAVARTVADTLAAWRAQTAGPAVTLSPPSLNFGTELVGTSSAPQNVILTCIGSDTVNLDSIAASTNFSQRNNCGSSLTPGASCTITVKFKPSSPGTQGTVTITDNAPNSPQTVMLTGVGTLVTLSPASLNFANQTVGTTSAPQTVTLTNNGGVTLLVQSIVIAGDFVIVPGSNSCGATVAVSTACTMQVAFAPDIDATYDCEVERFVAVLVMV